MTWGGSERDREKERNSMTIQLPTQQGAQRTRHEFIDTQPEDKEKKDIWILFFFNFHRRRLTYPEDSFFFLFFFSPLLSQILQHNQSQQNKHTKGNFTFFIFFVPRFNWTSWTALISRFCRQLCYRWIKLCLRCCISATQLTLVNSSLSLYSL